MQMRGVTLFIGLVVLMFVAGGVAHARTQKDTAHFSGSYVNVPADPDNDSCFTASNGGTICTDTSGYSNFAGKKSPGGGYTAQSIYEYDFMPGTSCNIAGTMVPGFASCTLAGSSEQGCLLQSAGYSEVDRDSSSGDLLLSTVAHSTICYDLSSVGPPFNFTSINNETITGGTGKNTGATGTRTETTRGQQLTSDGVGNGIGWFEGSSTETITTPDK